MMERNRAEDIIFAYCKFEARTSAHKKHVHKDAEEVIYIISGRGISALGDEEVEMKQGDTMFVPAPFTGFTTPLPSR